MVDIVGDLRAALRQLRSAPIFAAAAILTIGLAIGCTTGILGVADAVLFRSLPYSDPGRIFVVAMADPATGRKALGDPVPYEYVQAIDESHRGVSAVGMRGTQTMVAHVGEARAEWLSGVAVSPDYLRVLGMSPARGRVFDQRDAEEPGRAVILSHECWQRLFGGDDRVIGSSRKIGSQERAIIGVLPRGFVFPSVFVTGARFGISGRPDYVTTALPPGPGSARKFNAVVTPFGVIDPVVRLEAGVSREQAQIELERITRDIKPARAMPALTGFVPVLEEVRTAAFPVGRSIMAWLLVGAALVVLTGWANLAVLILARFRSRAPEYAVQLALGASRWRIVRPILVEALLLGLAGSCLGIAAANNAFNLLLQQVPPEAVGGASVGIDLRVAVMALTLGVATGILFGAIPAWRAAGLNVQDLLSGRSGQEGRRRGGVGAALVGVEVAAAIVLTYGAVIAGLAFADVLQWPLGFNPDRVAVLRLEPPRDVPTTNFYRHALTLLRARPDVVAAGAGGHLPLDGYAGDTTDADGRISIDFVLPGYLETIEARLIRGRLPQWDDWDSGGCVVTEAAARALFPGGVPLQQTIRTKTGRQLSIVGIIGDIRKDVEGQHRPVAFALPQGERRGFALVARMRASGPGTLRELEKEFAKLSPEDPLVASWWADDINALVPLRNPRFQVMVLGAFGALALAFTALGVFATLALVLAARRHEFGVRLALGAPPRSLAALTVRQAMLPVSIGCLAGLVLTRSLGALIKAQLYAVDTENPLTLGASVITVVGAAIVAGYAATRGTRHVDPVEVLRSS